MIFWYIMSYQPSKGQRRILGQPVYVNVYIPMYKQKSRDSDLYLNENVLYLNERNRVATN